MEWVGSVALVVGCGLVAAGAAVLAWRLAVAARAVRARGVVGQIRLAVASSTAGGPTVIVRFRAEDGKPHVFESRGQRAAQLVPGNVVDVLYPRDHPEQAVVAGAGAISFALPVALIAAGAACIGLSTLGALQ